MKWKRFTIDTTTEAIDFVSDMLNEIGVEGIEIDDNVPLSEADTKELFSVLHGMINDLNLEGPDMFSATKDKTVAEFQ